MAIAISDNYLREINMMSNEDKLDLIDLIVKSMKSASTRIGVGIKSHSHSWVDEIEGKWLDARGADEIVLTGKKVGIEMSCSKLSLYLQQR